MMLSCKFIFIDIKKKNGTWIYAWLKENNNNNKHNNSIKAEKKKKKQKLFKQI